MKFAWWHIGVVILCTLPNLWSIWHAWSHDFDNDLARKVKWLLLPMFIPVLGGLLYIAFGRQHAGEIIEKLRRK